MSIYCHIRPILWMKISSKICPSSSVLAKSCFVKIQESTSAPRIQQVFWMSTSQNGTPFDKEKVIKQIKNVSDNPPHFTANLEKKEVEEKYDEHSLPHPIWSREQSEAVKIHHKTPEGFVDHAAFFTVSALRKLFDLASGYTIGKQFKTLDERSVLIRCIFLETVAGVPGFSAAMIRHLHSLRRMQRDHGWIHTLLEEAENERMHLMTFLQLKKPGPFFRGVVIVSQWAFIVLFSSAYIVSPKFCHRFVGYLEDQAVVTYTHILEEIDSGNLPMWKNLPAPPMAIDYWKLPTDAMMRDVILAIRADEAHHRLVNHTLGSMDVRDKNPFKPGE